MRIAHLAFVVVASLSMTVLAQDSLRVQETNWLSSIRQTRQAVERAFGDAATFTESQQDHRGAFTVNVVPRDSLGNGNTAPARTVCMKKAINGMLRITALHCAPPGDTLVIRVWRQDAVVEHQLAYPLFAASVPFSALADTLLTTEKLLSSIVVDSLAAPVDGMLTNPR